MDEKQAGRLEIAMPPVSSGRAQSDWLTFHLQILRSSKLRQPSASRHFIDSTRISTTNQASTTLAISENK
jgi:hypothetical protein